MKVSDIRRFHANAIFHCIRVSPGTSQRDIVKATKFDKSTVSSIVSRFDELGLVLRTPGSGSSRPGRPTEGLSISPRTGVLAGVQVEERELGFVVAGLDGTPLSHRRQRFSGRVDTLADDMHAGVAALIA